MNLLCLGSLLRIGMVTGLSLVIWIGVLWAVN